MVICRKENKNEKHNNNKIDWIQVYNIMFMKSFENDIKKLAQVKFVEPNEKTNCLLHLGMSQNKINEILDILLNNQSTIIQNITDITILNILKRI